MKNYYPNPKEELEVMTIQWFPGHMLETENLLKKTIAKTDAVLEVLDARCPQASANPFVDKLCRSTFRLKVLNKDDLADPQVTRWWVKFFETELKMPCLAISGNIKDQAVKALNACVSKLERNKARKLKVMVIGIPNTGKSTILNALAGKKVAKTGNVPAITRHQQRTSLANNIDIYDTPGILWPVIEPERRAMVLAASGAISDTAVDYESIAFFAAQYLHERYKPLLLERYSFLSQNDEDPMLILEKIGKAKGCLKKGGRIDLQKASQALIRELRTGKIGRITFETPKDLDDEANP